MLKLEYTVDQEEYDTIILGTGMTEALFSASLSKIERRNMLIIDADQGYSSCQKSFNFKELFLDMEEKEKNKETNKLKKEFFTTLKLNEVMQQKNQQFVDEIMNKSTKYKQFNIDLQPKLLYSDSLVVDCMRQANMDQYMDFRAIDAIYFFDSSSKKFIQTPCSKSDIFKSKEFSLMEKKQLFQFLHKCISLYNRHFNKKVNQNSIEEFDKEFDVDEDTMNLYNKLKDQPCIEFLRDRISSKKVQDVFLYNLCNYEFNPNEPIPQFVQKDYTTKSFLHRLNKYIKSCGIHTALPYLYTNYGTGDIPQGYARISAIFGATYYLNKDIDIQSITKNEETGYFKIKSNLQRQPDEIVPPKSSEEEQDDSKPDSEDKKAEGQSQEQIESQAQNEINQNEKEKKATESQEEQTKKEDEKVEVEEEKKDNSVQEDKFIRTKSIIAGPEYKYKLQQLLGLEQKEVKEDMYLLRVTIISLKSETQVDSEKEVNNLDEEEKAKLENRYTCPILYSVPPTDVLGFKQPLSILHLDHSSMTSPVTHQVFYCKKVLENKEDSQQEVEKIVSFVENINVHMKNLPFKYTADYVWAYTQNRNEQGVFEQISEADKKFQVSLIGQDYFEIDMDKNFEEYRNTITTISSQINNQDENYFQTIQELNGEVDFYQNKIEEDDDFKGIDNLINKFEELKQQKVEPNQEGEEQKENQEAPQEQKEVKQEENNEKKEENSVNTNEINIEQQTKEQNETNPNTESTTN